MTHVVVTVKILGHRGTREVSLPTRAKISDLLERLGYSPQVVVTRRNGKVAIEEERLASRDFIEIIPIVTGG